MKILSHKAFVRIIIISWSIVALILYSSCATKTKIEYRDRDVNHYITNTVHDTLRQETHDSIFHTIYQKGDTIYNTKYIEKTKWKDRIVVKGDTCWRDSVITEYKESVKEVTKVPLIYKLSLLLSIIFCIFVIVKLLKWHRTL